MVTCVDCGVAFPEEEMTLVAWGDNGQPETVCPGCLAEW
jgi:hypothetical protein